MNLKSAAYLLLACLIGVSTLSMPQSALAVGDEILQQHMKPLSDYSSEIDGDVFERSTMVFEERIPQDHYLEYDIRLPLGWKRKVDSFDYRKSDDELGISEEIMGRIAEYYGPPRIDGTSFLEVHAQGMDFDISALHWLTQYILSRGYTLEGIKEHTRASAEAEYVTFVKDIPYVVRTKAMINGRRMVVVSMYVPDHYWKSVRSIQQRVIESFEFKSPEDVRISFTQNFKFLDLIDFEYPTTWRLIPPESLSIDNMNAELVRSNDGSKIADWMSPSAADQLKNQLNGQMNVYIVSLETFSTMAQEIELVREPLSRLDMIAGDLLESRDDFEFSEDILASHIEVYRLSHKEKRVQEHEYWLAILREAEYIYFITMVSPSRNYEFYEWARNVEGFKTVVESIRPMTF